MKVLVTTSYYWPEETGNAPYATGVAEHLSDRGHDVVVATGFPHYPHWKSSASSLGTTESRRGVRIRRRWHYVPHKQTALHRAAYEVSLLAFGLTALPIRWTPDVVVGTCPSVAGGALAAVAARAYRVPFGLVFQDLVGLAAEQSGIPGGVRVARFVQRIELRLARNAAAVGIVAEGFRSYLQQGGVDPQRVIRLRNWTQRVEPRETRGETRMRLGWNSDEFICVHGGNIGKKQGLDNLMDVAELLDSSSTRIVFVGDGSDRARLETEARLRGLSNVDFIPSLPSGAWEATLQAADVLLVNQRPSVTDMALPSKLTSYFASGRPVIAAVSKDSETANEITAAQAGIVVDASDSAALRDAILELRGDKARASELGGRGRTYAAVVLTREKALMGYDVFMEALASDRAGVAR